jgi:hypothetical protein
VLKELKVNLALEQSNVPHGEPLLTPAQRDKSTKSRQIAVTQATKATKRKQVVATEATANGTGALSQELQQANNRLPMVDNRTLRISPSNTAPVATAVAPSLPRPVVSPPSAPSTVPTPIVSPPKRKCEGCVHGDLLELKVLEPARIRHYLKQHEFLESATCAGACAKSIRAINLASPKANLHYCDVGKKGCDAPDDDPTKASMECGLVLCQACYETRGERYASANSQAGRSSRSTRRRHN